MGPTDVSNFDRWAPDYDSSALQSLVYEPAHRAVLERCARFVPTPRRMLDLGCGTGRLLSVAARTFPDAVLVGVDVSAGMLTVASTVGRRLALVRAVAEALPFASGSFDLVTATLTYRHWGDQAAGLREIRRVLAPRGVLVMATVAVPVGGRRWSWRRGRRRDRSASLSAALDRAGMRVLHRGRIFGMGPFNEVAIVLARPRRRRTRGAARAAV
jgi:ubiquinone/menaquinone biosynthesis C-methylase UbiE